MTDKPRPKGAGRLQLLLVALIFIVPLLAAMWLYYADNAPRPAGRTNHGVLLSPVVNLPDKLGQGEFLRAASNQWMLIYLQDGRCETACKDALYRMRQSRLMLGNDMSRVLRVLLHGTVAPDTLFLEREHAGLVAFNDRAAKRALADARPRDLSPGGLYLVDPLGNLVLYFPDDILPRQMVDDIEHLLELSRIG